jgi:hypothetical protein
MHKGGGTSQGDGKDESQSILHQSDGHGPWVSCETHWVPAARWAGSTGGCCVASRLEPAVP